MRKILFLVRRIKGVRLRDFKGQCGIVLNRHTVRWRYCDDLWRHFSDLPWMDRYFTDDCHDYGKIVGYDFRIVFNYIKGIICSF